MISSQMFKRLLQIAQCGSLTKAADILFISRPALVQQVKAAEAKLGFTVFDRSSKGVTLTHVGKVFLEEGEPIINKYEQLYRKCRSMTDQIPKSVVIGTLPEIYSPLLFTICRKYKKKYPDVEIVLKQETFADYFSKFLTGGFDITTDYMLNFAQDLAENPAIETVFCQPTQLMICISNNDPLAGMKMAAVKHLRDRKLMMHARGLSKADDMLRDYLETHEPSVTIIDHPYFSHELLIKAEMENAVVVCVRKHWFELPNFKRVPMDWDFPVERGIFYRKNCRPEVKDFIELSKQVIEENDI